MTRKLVLLFAAFAAIGLIGAGSAAAAPPPLGISCTVAGDNSLQCGSTSPRSTAETWDGTPIDVNIALPDPAEFGTGPYPLVMMFHGYGQSKLPFAQMAHYTDKGYAAFTMSDRGMAESCGSVASVAADPDGCDGQYITCWTTVMKCGTPSTLRGSWSTRAGSIQPGSPQPAVRTAVACRWRWPR